MLHYSRRDKALAPTSLRSEGQTEARGKESSGNEKQKQTKASALTFVLNMLMLLIM